MRILVVSNFYPPNFHGGYELVCRDVVEGLRKRGHEVHVATAQTNQVIFEDPRIHARLPIYERWITNPRDIGFAGEAIKVERAAVGVLSQLVRQIRPDILYLWGTTRLSLQFNFGLPQFGIPVCYYVADHFLPQLWTAKSVDGSWSRSLLLKLLRAAFARNVTPSADVQFLSRYLFGLVQGTLDTERAKIIHAGVDLKCFSRTMLDRPRPRGRLLFMARLVEEKGLHTAIHALALLKDLPFVTLTVAGAFTSDTYRRRIMSLLAEKELTARVRFIGKQSPENLPALLCDYETLLLPSEWAEPWGLIALQAMASGTSVVSTLVGGTPEWLLPEVNALSHEPGNPRELATAIRNLVDHPQLRRALICRAREDIERRFDFEATVDQIECQFDEIMARPRWTAR